jgi:hypothetical protein
MRNLRMEDWRLQTREPKCIRRISAIADFPVERAMNEKKSSSHPSPGYGPNLPPINNTNSVHDSRQYQNKNVKLVHYYVTIVPNYLSCHTPVIHPLYEVAPIYKWLLAGAKTNCPIPAYRIIT